MSGTRRAAGTERRAGTKPGAEGGAGNGRTIRIGTRGSALALAQARLVAAALEEHGLAHEVVIVETAGDRRAPDTAWGEGAFVAAIERALLEDRVDLAVHSAKDVPTDEDPRLTIAAFLPRADPRDALVVRAEVIGTGADVAAGASARTESTESTDDGPLAVLPQGARVGTDSPRRTAFLRARRPDLDVRPLHGNVDTRLRRLDEGQADALVLAVAGLARLGRDDRITARLDAEVVPPAPGQGAIAIQVRATDTDLAATLAAVDDPTTRIAVEAERAFLHASGGGCRAPIGALATLDGTDLRLFGGMANEADGRIAVDTIAGPAIDRVALAASLAARLSTAIGGRPGAVTDPARGGDDDGGEALPTVIVTRTVADSEALVLELSTRGVEAAVVPAIEIELAGPDSQLDAEVRRLADYAWVVVTSRHAVRAIADAATRAGAELDGPRWAAVGTATAAALRAIGIEEPWLPDVADVDTPAATTGARVASRVPIAVGARVLVPRSSLADEVVPQLLAGRGARVAEVEAYRTTTGPASSRELLATALLRRPGAVLLASPSAVEGIVAVAGDRRSELLAIPAICIGPTTAVAAALAGFTVLGQSAEQTSVAVADRTVDLLRASPVGATR